MKKILLISTVAITALFANSEPLHVSLDIYSNKAFINKSFALEHTGEITTIVPSYVNLNTMKNNISTGCKIESSTLSSSMIIKDNLSTKIDKLESKKDNLSYKISALLANETLLKSLSLKNESDTLKIDIISSYMTKNLIENASKIKSVKKELNDIEKELKKIKLTKREYKEYKILYTCNNKDATLELAYPQGNVRYKSFYDINADTNNKTVTIEKNANIDYRGVENFSNIDLNIYSYMFNKNVAPQTFYPKYLGERKKVLYKQARTMAVMSDSMQEGSSPQVNHKQLGTKSVYNIKGISLIYGAKNLLHVDKEVINAKFRSTIDAYGTNKAYLEASIKANKNYPNGMANYSLNTNPISSRHMKKLQKGKKEKLYFGEDEHIQIKKELIKTLNDKTFFGDKKVSTQNWSYKITSIKTYSTEISFIERVPVSKNAEIIVKTLSSPKQTHQNAKGKTVWEFTLEPKETKSIIFGYEISSENK